ncbi:MAG: Leucine Rich Repeat domain protein (Modular protein), partial [Thermotogales bacterium 46_20]
MKKCLSLLVISVICLSLFVGCFRFLAVKTFETEDALFTLKNGTIEVNAKGYTQALEVFVLAEVTAANVISQRATARVVSPYADGTIIAVALGDGLYSDGEHVMTIKGKFNDLKYLDITTQSIKAETQIETQALIPSNGVYIQDTWVSPEGSGFFLIGARNIGSEEEIASFELEIAINTNHLNITAVDLLKPGEINICNSVAQINETGIIEIAVAYPRDAPLEARDKPVNLYRVHFDAREGVESVNSAVSFDSVTFTWIDPAQDDKIVPIPDVLRHDGIIMIGDPILLGDFNNDGIVNSKDLAMFAPHYKKKYDPRDDPKNEIAMFDIGPASKGFGGVWSNIFTESERDGSINIFDLTVLAQNFYYEKPEGYYLFVRSITELNDAITKNMNPIVFGASIFGTANTITKAIDINLNGYSLESDLTINTADEGVMNLFAGEISGNLTVNAPNASFNNFASVTETIFIEDVSSGTWNEYPDGNNIVWNAQDKTLIVYGSPSGIEFNEPVSTVVFYGPTNVTGGANIQNAVINSPGVVFDEPPENVVLDESIRVINISSGSVHETIQAAIDAAEPGDALILNAGFFYESVVIDKRLYVQGQSNEADIEGNTIINPVSGPGLVISSGGESETERLFLKDFWVGGSKESGIVITGDSPSHITLSKISSLHNEQNGILISNTGTAKDLRFEDCDISNNAISDIPVQPYYGIHVASVVDNLVIVGSRFIDNRFAGISLDQGEGKNITIEDVQILKDASDAQQGVRILSRPGQVIEDIAIVRTTISGGFRNGIYIFVEGGTFSGFTLSEGVIESPDVSIFMSALDPGTELGDVGEPTIFKNISIHNMHLSSGLAAIYFGVLPTAEGGEALDISIIKNLLVDHQHAAFYNADAIPHEPLTITDNTFVNNRAQVQDNNGLLVDLESLLTENLFDRAVVVRESEEDGEIKVSRIFSTPQHAHDGFADPGDRIEIYKGTYAEDLHLTKPLSLFLKGDVILQGAISSEADLLINLNGFQLTADHFFFRNCVAAIHNGTLVPTTDLTNWYDDGVNEGMKFFIRSDKNHGAGTSSLNLLQVNIDAVVDSSHAEDPYKIILVGSASRHGGVHDDGGTVATDSLSIVDCSLNVPKQTAFPGLAIHSLAETVKIDNTDFRNSYMAAFLHGFSDESISNVTLINNDFTDLAFSAMDPHIAVFSYPDKESLIINGVEIAAGLDELTLYNTMRSLTDSLDAGGNDFADGTKVFVSSPQRSRLSEYDGAKWNTPEPTPAAGNFFLSFSLGSQQQAQTFFALSNTTTELYLLYVDVEDPWNNGRILIEEDQNTIELRKGGTYVLGICERVIDHDDNDKAEINVLGLIGDADLGLHSIPVSLGADDIIDLGEIVQVGEVFTSQLLSGSDLSGLVGYEEEDLRAFGNYDITLKKFLNPDINKNGVFDTDEDLLFAFYTQCDFPRFGLGDVDFSDVDDPIKIDFDYFRHLDIRYFIFIRGCELIPEDMETSYPGILVLPEGFGELYDPDAGHHGRFHRVGGAGYWSDFGSISFNFHTLDLPINGQWPPYDGDHKLVIYGDDDITCEFYFDDLVFVKPEDYLVGFVFALVDAVVYPDGQFKTLSWRWYRMIGGGKYELATPSQVGMIIDQCHFYLFNEVFDESGDDSGSWGRQPGYFGKDYTAEGSVDMTQYDYWLYRNSSWSSEWLPHSVAFSFLDTGDNWFGMNARPRIIGEPMNPSPHNGQTNVDLEPTLTWEAFDDGETVVYTVYVGTSEEDFETYVTTDKSIEPSELQPATTYYWTIHAEVQDRPNSEERGLAYVAPIWSFTTAGQQAGDGVTLKFTYGGVSGAAFSTLDEPQETELFLLYLDIDGDRTIHKVEIIEGEETSVQLHKGGTYIMGISRRTGGEGGVIEMLGLIGDASLGLHTLPISTDAADTIDLGEIVQDGEVFTSELTTGDDLSSLLGYDSDTLSAFGLFDITLKRFMNPDINNDGIYDVDQGIDFRVVTKPDSPGFDYGDIVFDDIDDPIKVSMDYFSAFDIRLFISIKGSDCLPEEGEPTVPITLTLPDELGVINLPGGSHFDGFHRLDEEGWGGAWFDLGNQPINGRMPPFNGEYYMEIDGSAENCPYGPIELSFLTPDNYLEGFVFPLTKSIVYPDGQFKSFSWRWYRMLGEGNYTLATPKEVGMVVPLCYLYLFSEDFDSDESYVNEVGEGWAFSPEQFGYDYAQGGTIDMTTHDYWTYRNSSWLPYKNAHTHFNFWDKGDNDYSMIDRIHIIGEPRNPIPEDDSQGVTLNPTLSWESFDDDETVVYTVYVGISEEDLVGSPLWTIQTTNKSVLLEGLDPLTTYYWTIHAEVQGRANSQERGLAYVVPTWSFTTEDPMNNPPNTPSNPSPEDGAGDQPIILTLSWTCSDPDGDDLVYDLYGAEQGQSLMLFESGIVGKSFMLNFLEENKTYNWQIAANDQRGGYTLGPVWTFSTGEFEDTVVEFHDTELEQAVRDAVGIPDGPLYKSDVMYLGHLSAPGRGIASIEGIEHLLSLEFLDLGADWDVHPATTNNITDISPIASLANLRVLNMDLNSASDLSPLANLVNLRELWYGGNQVTDLSPISDLTNLEILCAWENNIEDLLPIQNLTNLRMLDINGNNVSNIGALAGLTSLEELHLSHNPISSLTPIHGLYGLKILSMTDINLYDTDIEFLSDLEHLTHLWINWNHNLTDLNPLSGLDLQLLDAAGNKFSDIGPLSGMVNLEDLMIGWNEISNIDALEHLVSLRTLLLDENFITDITALVNNAKNNGLGDGCYINLVNNYLDLTEGSDNMNDIKELTEDYGVTVDYEPQRVPNNPPLEPSNPSPEDG